MDEAVGAFLLQQGSILWQWVTKVFSPSRATICQPLAPSLSEIGLEETQ